MGRTKYWDEERITKDRDMLGCSFCGVEMAAEKFFYVEHPTDEEEYGMYLCQQSYLHKYTKEYFKINEELWSKYFKIYFLSIEEQAEQNILNLSAQVDKKVE